MSFLFLTSKDAERASLASVTPSVGLSRSDEPVGESGKRMLKYSNSKISNYRYVRLSIAPNLDYVLRMDDSMVVILIADDRIRPS